MNPSPVMPDQLFHGIPPEWASFTCNAASTPTKRTPSRVSKPNCFYKSPQGIQRRRTTASHSARGSLVSHREVEHVAQLQKDSSSRHRWPANSGRPMSWHPGARWWSQAFSHHGYVGEPMVGNTIDGFEHLAVSGHGSLTGDSSSSGTYPTQEVSAPYDMPLTGFYASMYMGGDMGLNGQADHPHPNAELYTHNAGFSLQTSPSSMPYQYSSTMSTCASSQAFLNTHGPSMPHAHHPSQQLRMQVTQSATPKARNKKSKELMGLGLYDDTAKVQRESIGKMLKLEDAWQPSEKKEGEDQKPSDDLDQESSSEDEDDELPAMPINPEPPRQIPVYQDLSNQSFFFESDDPLANIMAEGPDLSLYQPKMPPPVQTDFSWI